MTPEPKRHWNQFRLRTLLIVVVVLAIPCGFVANAASIVRERKAWLLAHPSQGESFLIHVASVGNESLSRLRIWLGDVPQPIIIVRDSDSLADKQAAKTLFPEAEVAESP